MRKCTVTYEVTSWNYGNIVGYGLSMLDWEKMYGKTLVKHVGMPWSYGNVLHYYLSMFVEFEKLSYPSVNSISVILNVLNIEHY